MDANFENNTLIVGLSKEDSLLLLGNHTLTCSTMLNDRQIDIVAIAKTKREESYRQGYTLGSEVYKRSLGYKACSAYVEEGTVTVRVSRTLLAANEYLADELSPRNIETDTNAPFLGYIRVTFELFDSEEAQNHVV
jgi:hypothetical protein